VLLADQTLGRCVGRYCIVLQNPLTLKENAMVVGYNYGHAHHEPWSLQILFTIDGTTPFSGCNHRNLKSFIKWTTQPI
jgi:hypothetical protein